MASYNKLVQLRPEICTELDELQAKIDENGGSVSISRLIQDAVIVYIKYYSEQAVQKYSPYYDFETDEKNA